MVLGRWGGRRGFLGGEGGRERLVWVEGWEVRERREESGVESWEVESGKRRGEEGICEGGNREGIERIWSGGRELIFGMMALRRRRDRRGFRRES